MPTELKTMTIGEIEGVFVLPDYQRGYRWGELEVRTLLEDLKNHITKDSDYYLQPVVVKKRDNSQFELIDGQQRLTTLFLMYRAFKPFLPKTQHKYSLVYDTDRNDVADFLMNVNFDDLRLDYSYIDKYYISYACKVIDDWIKGQGDDNDQNDVVGKLSSLFHNKLKIIWYEVDSNVDGSAIFDRLNIGKIPLTNAEIIKAHLLKRDKREGAGSAFTAYDQYRIATDWDLIEHELHNDEFWYFLTGKPAEHYPVRVELILDYMMKKSEGERDRFWTFHEVEQKIKTCVSNASKSSVEVFWSEFTDYYYRLREWYEDNDYYHWVGFLLHRKRVDKTGDLIYDLMTNAQHMDKPSFEKELHRLIAETISSDSRLSGITDYSQLGYMDSPETVSKLLEMANCETCRREDSTRFPFKEHREGSRWTLEHIHAQNENEMKNVIEIWREWLESHIRFIRSIDNNTDKITSGENEVCLSEIEKWLSSDMTENGGRARFEKYYTAVIDYVDSLSGGNPQENIHLLSNLALLDGGQNSVLSNSVFDIKRNKIIEMDKKGEYIPSSTKKVFLKYYSQSESLQIHFWGEEDKRDYLSNLQELLNPYLKPLGKTIEFTEAKI